MKLVFQPHEKPKFGANIVFAIQQLLAIMAATLVVPVIINSSCETTMSPAAALFGAGIGTFVYLLFTKFRSPVFLGSSFAFIGSMCAAFAGGISMSLGYLGLILGAVFAGLVYVVLAIIVKLVGVNWINKLMPAAVIGPTVAIIGLSLAGNAVGDLQKAPAGGHTLIAVVCGLVTLIVTVISSTYGKKMAKMIPFIIGILAGYAVGSIFTLIGSLAGIDALKVIDYSSI
ncbi:MAG: uracil-xanthine permease, partial [Clostridia bacterium]|nr:uracil-xanthine permease [Clostridia bacterium]